MAGSTWGLRPRTPPLGPRVQVAVVARMATWHSGRRLRLISRFFPPLRTSTSARSLEKGDCPHFLATTSKPTEDARRYPPQSWQDPEATAREPKGRSPAQVRRQAGAKRRRAGRITGGGGRGGVNEPYHAPDPASPSTTSAAAEPPSAICPKSRQDPEGTPREPEGRSPARVRRQAERSEARREDYGWGWAGRC